MATTTTWFTVARMKTFAIVILALDALLLLAWTSGAIYLITRLGEVECSEMQFIAHFLILIHFALAAYIATMIGEISRAQEEHRQKYDCMRKRVNGMVGVAKKRGERRLAGMDREVEQLPYHFYLPVAWISVAAVSFLGDVILLAAGSKAYELEQGHDECQSSRLTHIIFDVVATAISVVAIVWFIFFTVYTTRTVCGKNKDC